MELRWDAGGASRPAAAAISAGPERLSASSATSPGVVRVSLPTPSAAAGQGRGGGRPHPEEVTGSYGVAAVGTRAGLSATRSAVACSG